MNTASPPVARAALPLVPGGRAAAVLRELWRGPCEIVLARDEHNAEITKVAWDQLLERAGFDGALMAPAGFTSEVYAEVGPEPGRHKLWTTGERQDVAADASADPSTRWVVSIYHGVDSDGGRRLEVRVGPTTITLLSVDIDAIEGLRDLPIDVILAAEGVR